MEVEKIVNVLIPGESSKVHQCTVSTLEKYYSKKRKKQGSNRKKMQEQGLIFPIKEMLFANVDMVMVIN